MKSPFRYPGSKARLLDWILPKILQNDSPFIDIFVGGGSISLAVAQRDKSRKIILNDFDPFMADFWRCLLYDYQTKALIDQIETYKPSIDSYLELQKLRLSEPSAATWENAFLALAINRMAFSGIAMSGAIGGIYQLSQYKVDCRWNAKSLVKHIKFAAELLKDRTEVTCLDFTVALDFHSGFYYLDPPYYKQGSVLYPVYLSTDQHKNLAEILKEKNNWLLSYDGCQEIHDLYSFADIEERDQHSMLARSKKKEVLISPRD